MLPKVPLVRLVRSKTRTVNARLLPCADSDCLSVFDEADAVRLCVFEHYQRKDEISLVLRRERFFARNKIGKALAVDFYVVSRLFKRNAENLLFFNRGRRIVLVDLNNAVRAFFLLRKNFECRRAVRRGDNAVGDFFCNEACSRLVAFVRKCDKVSE